MWNKWTISDVCILYEIEFCINIEFEYFIVEDTCNRTLHIEYVIGTILNIYIYSLRLISLCMSHISEALGVIVMVVMTSTLL